MGKYLQAVEPYYSGDYATIGDDGARARVAEGTTAYEYRLRKGKVACNGVAKVILAGPVAQRRVEDLIDVLRYEHPLGEHPEVDALPTLHARFVGEVHHALRELGADRRWDLDALEAVYRQLVEADYRFNGVWAKPKWNAGRTCAVGVEWRTGRQLELGFTVTPRGGETRWAPFLASPIGLGKIDTAAGKLVWQDDRHAVLWHSNKRDLWRIDTGTLQIDFLYAPAEEGNPHGQYQLGKMYLDGNQWVAVDPVKARYWLVKSADQGFARAKRLLEAL
jgi:hypothetical protein